mmetsp:Transcript_2284/g.5851  ORF Transcript_2284/g.5851 Transcript_2284/m.5851 type:complete len:260 (+) Transcript_2284:3235-4014(+)
MSTSRAPWKRPCPRCPWKMCGASTMTPACTAVRSTRWAAREGPPSATLCPIYPPCSSSPPRLPRTPAPTACTCATPRAGPNICTCASSTLRRSCPSTAPRCTTRSMCWRSSSQPAAALGHQGRLSPQAAPSTRQAHLPPLPATPASRPTIPMPPKMRPPAAAGNPHALQHHPPPHLQQAKQQAKSSRHSSPRRHRLHSHKSPPPRSCQPAWARCYARIGPRDPRCCETCALQSCTLQAGMLWPGTRSIGSLMRHWLRAS